MKVINNENENLQNIPYKKVKIIYDEKENLNINLDYIINIFQNIFYEISKMKKILIILTILIIIVFSLSIIDSIFYFGIEPIAELNINNIKKNDTINENFYVDTNDKIKIKKKNYNNELDNNFNEEYYNIKINSTKEIENEKKSINKIKEKLHLKDDLSFKIIHILNKTEYKNTDINQYINYTKLLNPIKEKKIINPTLIDPSELLIEPFFTKEYTEKLDLFIIDNQDPKFNPSQNKNAEYYLEKYFVYLCKNKILLDKNKYKKSEHPKISIIIPVYNRAQYIQKILLSIQNQNLKDIEIIFVNDKSTDNATKIIKNLMNEEDRIVLLNNKKNSGTFYTRFVGIVFSKGNYIIFADSDDFLLPDILGNAYNAGKKNNVEIVQYSYLTEQSFGNVKKTSKTHTTDVILNANKIKYLMFYEHHENYAKIENYFLWDKIYKRELLLKTMHKFQDELIIDNLRVHDDNLFLFTIFQNANSYYYIDQCGYYRSLRKFISFKNNNILTIKDANKSFNDIFKNLQFIFNYTPNLVKYRMMCFANFRNLMFINGNKLKHVTEGIEFMKEVLNLYLTCKYYNGLPKEKLMKALNTLNENQARLNKMDNLNKSNLRSK